MRGAAPRAEVKQKPRIYFHFSYFNCVITLDKPLFLWYIILMKDIKETTDFIVTTSNGTRWAETGVSFGQVRRQFFGKRLGLKIEKIERGRLFTHEEEAELKREKDEERCR